MILLARRIIWWIGVVLFLLPFPIVLFLIGVFIERHERLVVGMVVASLIWVLLTTWCLEWGVPAADLEDL